MQNLIVHISNLRKSNRFSALVEQFLVFTLSGLSITTFFMHADKGWFNFFSLLSLFGLLVLRFGVTYKHSNPLPKPLFIISLLFALSVVVSALMSDNRHLAFILVKNYRFIFIGGLLLTVPLRDNYRRIIVASLFTTAVIAGLIGILQYFRYLPLHVESLRPDGFLTNPNFYAAILSLVCSSSLLVIFSRKALQLTTRLELLFLIIVVLFTFCGVVLSQSRSIYLALLTSIAIIIYLHKPWKNIAFIVIVAICFLSIISSSALRERVISIVSSLNYASDGTQSTGNRLQLWKGSLLIFTEHPLFGVGLGDFQENIEQLVAKNRINKITNTAHAHNIYLQVLATRGISGLVILLSLFYLMLNFGVKLIRSDEIFGGHILITSIALTMVAGLTDNQIEFTMFLSAFCLIIGLMGPIKTSLCKEET